MRRFLGLSDSNDGLARLAIVAAVALQATGKVAYGTLLASFPAPLFVFISFTLTAIFFLSTSRKSAGRAAWGTLLFLNVATAVTFLSLFVALKLIQPAIVGAIEISIGPIAAIVIGILFNRNIPSLRSLLVCCALAMGCAILASSALSGFGFQSSETAVVLGLLASVTAGIGAVVITIASKSLLSQGWRFSAVLAHRFYLIVPVSLALVHVTGASSVEWSIQLAYTVIFVSIIGVLAPLFLLQVGISRCDPYTVMVTLAVLPILTFAIEGVSSKYQWSAATAVGLAVITGAVLWDASRSRG